MRKETLEPKVLEIINRYFELPLGGKKVKAPYFMNLKGQVGGLRVLIGKGSAEEIVHETKVWAQLKGFDLSKASKQEIREFMIERSIGIDCSGFVVHVLNVLSNLEGKGSLWKNLKYFNNGLIAKIRRTLRPVENIGANLLTSDLNCERIDDLNQIRPGDLIRAKGKQKNAHHVALVTTVYRDNEKLIKFEYVHAHRFYEEQNGVRQGVVEVDDLQKELKNQKWFDDYKGRNYMLEDLLVDYEDNGIRRLRIFA